MRRIFRLLKHFYYKIRTSRTARKFINAAHKKRFSLNPPVIKSNEQEILKTIADCGVSQCSIEDFFDSEVIKAIENRGNAIREYLIPFMHSKDTKDSGDKNFLVRYYDHKTHLDIEDPIILEVIKGRFFNIARSYLGQDIKISNIDYWLNFDNQAQEAPISSQNWHRDYEDERVLKLFLYFSDVTLNHGPLSYVKGTQKGGEYSDHFPVSPPLGVSGAEQQVSDHFDKRKVKEFCVPKGTLLFADTAGMHKGGFCRGETRFLFTATFTSFAGISPRNYYVDKAAIKPFADNTKKALGYLLNLK